VPKDRNESWGRCDLLPRDAQRLAQGSGPTAPFVQPELVVLHVKEDALQWHVEPFAKRSLVAVSPIGKTLPARQRRLQKRAKVRGKPKTELVLHCAELRVRKSRFKLTLQASGQ
jgi:hypothetical protein